jgi:ATP-dependent RNA helicase DeaD
MNIEKATKQKVEEMGLPSTEVINNKRISRFKQNITDTLAKEELSFFVQLLEQYQQEHNVSALEIAAALAKLVQGETPLLIANLPKRSSRDDDDRGGERDSRRGRERSDRPERSERSNADRGAGARERKPRRSSDVEMELFRIEVGHAHGVKPGNIVGAIANETGIDGDHIARIKIEETYSTVELPAGMPKELIAELKKVRVVGQLLSISKVEGGRIDSGERERRPVDKSKKRISSTSTRAKPKAAE